MPPEPPAATKLVTRLLIAPATALWYTPPLKRMVPESFKPSLANQSAAVRFSTSVLLVLMTIVPRSWMPQTLGPVAVLELSTYSVPEELLTLIEPALRTPASMVPLPKIWPVAALLSERSLARVGAFGLAPKKSNEPPLS